ncbi:gamma-glutamyltransferase family protein [Pendulispora albinea]|uniref:Gamma-glutamyltransferase family protein n=1 Tax=Pendulispora albinea TaxID=2741071 RepID=A0ABZ2LM91_9BACT
MTTVPMKALGGAAFLLILASAPMSGGQAWAQPAPLMSACDAEPRPPACNAVRGDRAEGWRAQGRAEVMAQHGMVTSSQPLASQAGLQVLMKGGNAIDAAIAASAVLNVVEPMNTGIAGDLFVMVYIAKEKKLYALNASGMAPTGANLERFQSLGYRADPANFGPGSGMPGYGILPVTVPGAAWGWEELLKRFGKKTFKDVLAPAIDYAENGFPISQRIAHDWVLPNALPLRGCCTAPDPDTIKTWYIDGKQPVAGQVFRNADLAKTFRLLAQHGRDVFYKGEIAKAIVAKSNALGGSMTLEDLATYKGEWSTPATSEYRGYRVAELPPPSQAWGTNVMLNVLETCMPKWAPGQSLASLGPRNAKYWHFLVEAKKLAYADLFRYNGDPNFVKIPLADLLSKAHAEKLCSKVDPKRASSTGPAAPVNAGGDTVVLSTADAEGNMVSWVSSNYQSFGSGITVPGYGFVLHNRGSLFSLSPTSPNVIAPHKRPFNTLSAGFVMRNDNTPLMSILLMGGDMQAQGHAQTLVSILDLGANLQAATDMARFHHVQVPNRLELESSLANLIGRDLLSMGHNVVSIDGTPVGGFQSILFTPLPAGAPAGAGAPRVHGFYRAASDHRKDGEAVGW